MPTRTANWRSEEDDYEVEKLHIANSLRMCHVSGSWFVRRPPQSKTCHKIVILDGDGLLPCLLGYVGASLEKEGMDVQNKVY